jgi:hypothetical protein
MRIADSASKGWLTDESVERTLFALRSGIPLLMGIATRAPLIGAAGELRALGGGYCRIARALVGLQVQSRYQESVAAVSAC